MKNVMRMYRRMESTTIYRCYDIEDVKMDEADASDAHLDTTFL
jgi:hypothetical protein